MARVLWFRFYSEVLHDPKVQLLSPTDFKAWVNLLCLANESEPRGSLPIDADVGYALRISPFKAGQLTARFMEMGFLDVDERLHRLVIHNWQARQFASDVRDTDGRRRADDVRRREDGKWVNPPPIDGEHAAIARRNGGDFAVTETDTEQRQITETDQIQIIPPKPPLPSRVVAVAFEQCFGRLLSGTELELVKVLEDEHPSERIEYALREAAALNKRSVRYVQRTCERIATDGGDTTGRPKVASKRYSG